MAALHSGIAPLWHVPIEQYHTMIDRGILGPDDRVELLEGIIVQKMSKNPPHSTATGLTRSGLEQVIPPNWYVRAQEPITLQASEPEPDIAVIRGDARMYARRHPGPSDIGLVVEVSDTTLDRDRIVKKRIYATAGIPFYWLLDLNSRKLETYSEPEGSEYARATEYEAHESVAVVLDGVTVGSVAVSDLLP